jgi:hypothetical protein
VKIQHVLNGTSWNTGDIEELIWSVLRWAEKEGVHLSGNWRKDSVNLSIQYSQPVKVTPYRLAELAEGDLKFEVLSTGETFLKIQLPRPNRLYDKKALASLLDGAVSQEAGFLSSPKAGVLLMSHLVRHITRSWDWENRLSRAKANIGEENVKIRYEERKKKSSDVQKQRLLSLQLRKSNAQTKINYDSKVMQQLASKYAKKKNQIEKLQSRMGYYADQIEKLEKKFNPKD